ncbi:hypothetical protein GCM10027347_44550 [Larkinella harenae]
MKKVIIAILTAAVREKTPCSIIVKGNGGVLYLVGASNAKSLRFATEPTAEFTSVSLDIMESLTSDPAGALTLECEAGAITVSQSQNAYTITIGDTSIAFLKPFLSDPFTPPATSEIQSSPAVSPLYATNR